MEVEISFIPALRDNYCYLLREKSSRECLVIDPSEAAPVAKKLDRDGLRLALILNTHHHHDHVGGNEELHRATSAPVYCSTHDLARVPCSQRGFDDKDKFRFGGIEIEVIYIPGHTLGQVAFYVKDASALFVGDTVFAMGCGRLFEGTPAQMWASLERLMRLPPETKIHFGHEYTAKNAAFAASIEPDNSEITERAAKAAAAVQATGISPAPTLAEEMRVNPFLRVREPKIRARLGMEKASDAEVLARLRKMRDEW